MAKLTFQRNNGVIILTSRDHKILGVWRSHNRTSTGHQPWPDGTWAYDSYNPHPELSGPSTVCDCWSGSGLPTDTAGLGCFGIHLFRVRGRSGLGIHAGRTPAPPAGNLVSLGGKTLGCIRVPPDAMLKINQIHFGGDRIKEITVELGK